MGHDIYIFVGKYAPIKLYILIYENIFIFNLIL